MILRATDSNSAEQVASPHRVVNKPPTNTLGLFPLLAVISSLGVLALVLAYEGARSEAAWSGWLYWTALMLQIVPVFVRLLAVNPTREERILLVLMLGMSLYFVKVFYSPTVFRFEDEMQQWRSAYESIQSKHLFSDNPILEVSPYYPGLQNALTALVNMGGMGIFPAGVILIGVVRIILMLSLYLTYEQLSESERIAGIATAVYTVNPGFLVWGSYLVYQSLALPVSIFALYCAVRWSRAKRNDHTGLLITLMGSLFSVIITHHITSYMINIMMVLLVAGVTVLKRVDIDLLWHEILASVQAHKLRQTFKIAVAIAKKDPLEITRYERRQPPVIWLALLSFVATLLWIVYAATITVDYLEPQFADITQEALSLFGPRESDQEEVFVMPDRPPVELAIGIASIGLLLVMLPFTVKRTAELYYDDPMAVTAAVSSLSYGFMLVLRFVSRRGGELLSRMWPFLFILMSFPLAVGAAESLKNRHFGTFLRWAIPGLFAFMFIGGVLNGWPPYWSRLPGPYLAAARERSVDLKGISAANWSRAVLGRDHIVTGDWTNNYLQGSYGLQNPNDDVPEIFLNAELNQFNYNQLRTKRIEFIFVNLRFAELLPTDGYYYAYWEYNAKHYIKPLDAELLTKFDTAPGIYRVYDGGDTIVYDVRSLSNAQVP